MNTYEENPFETEQGASEWIAMVESEKGTNRDKEIYPFLKSWIAECEPKTVADIGAGQGICSIHLGTEDMSYFGIEPSGVLINRAEELYAKANRNFIVGNAYELPLGDKSMDACFSIMTWFHLADLDQASKELSRALVDDGHFFIVTPNPNAYDIWESFFSDVKKSEKYFTGVNKILLNPDDKSEGYKYAQVTNNTFYTHTIDEITGSLEKHNLKVDSVEEFGVLPITNGRSIFIKIVGHRI